VIALSIDDPQLGEKAVASWADAIILDFAKRPERNWQDDLRSRMPAAIHMAAQGGAVVFVRFGCEAAVAELDATVFAGLAGIVLTGATGVKDIARVAQCLDALESSRGIAADTLEIDVEVDNAAAVWHALDIARANARFGVAARSARRRRPSSVSIRWNTSSRSSSPSRLLSAPRRSA
jgi:citrate lyase beta subunit